MKKKATPLPARASGAKPFGALSLRGIRKMGDVVLPGDGKNPRFSETRLLEHFPRISSYMTPADREGFRMLTLLLGLAPKFAIRGLFALLRLKNRLPAPLASVFRQLDIGMKGVVYTLYYSGIEGEGARILAQMDYVSKIGTPVTPDAELENLYARNNPLSRGGYPVDAELLAPNDQTPTKVYATARAAEAEISALSVRDRLAYVAELRRVILARQEEIIDVIQKETRKARTDILTSEIFPVMEHLEFLERYAGDALKPEKVPTPIAMMGKASEIWFEPLGTLLVISPWNYPFYQAIVPITASFVAGNATVYKPSELTPLTGLVESALKDAGFKSGWAQVVYGDGRVGSRLIDGRPQKVFFTGSVATGKKIMTQAAQYLIPVELELGGKDPMIVFEDVNLERAVRGAIWGAFTNSGQSCTSVERLYVQESIYPRFRDRLVEEARTIKTGVDSDGDADMGAMISDRQVAIVAELVKDAVAGGAKMLTGQDWDFQSRAIPPIVLEGTTHAMRINREEIFGPVLPIFPFKDEAEAVVLANDSTFGLSASVWSKDKDRARRVSSKIVTGNVSINNVMLSEGNHALPFGGAKDSGIGRYKGVHGLRGFTLMKSVLVDGDSAKIEANWYPYTPTKYRLFSGLTQALFSGGLRKWVGLVKFGLPLESHAKKAKRAPPV